MKEFDIYLNKRPTECDIIVYSIPYRDSLFVASELILDTDAPVDAFVGQTLGTGDSAFELESGMIQTMTKNSVERFSPALVLDAKLTDTFKHGHFEADSGTVFKASIGDFGYHLDAEATETGFTLGAVVLDTDTLLSLGSGENAFVIGIELLDDYALGKCISAEHGIIIGAESDSAITYFVSPESVGPTFGFDAEYIMKRHRVLEETDDAPLSSYDNMTLEDLDYIIL